MAECYKRALCAEFRLNQMKAEKAKGRKDRGRKENLTSEIVIKPSSSEKDQGSRKKMRLSNAESQKTSSKKRNYVLKAYCRKCRHNYAGVYRRTQRLFVSAVREMGISLETVPTRKLTKNREVSKSQEMTSGFANFELVDQSKSLCKLTCKEWVSATSRKVECKDFNCISLTKIPNKYV